MSDSTADDLKDLICKIFKTMHTDKSHDKHMVVLAYMCKHARSWTCWCQIKNDLFYMKDSDVRSALAFLIKTKIVASQVDRRCEWGCDEQCTPQGHYMVTYEMFIADSGYRARLILNSCFKSAITPYKCTTCDAMYPVDDVTKLLDARLDYLKCLCCQGRVTLSLDAGDTKDTGQTKDTKDTKDTDTGDTKDAGETQARAKAVLQDILRLCTALTSGHSKESMKIKIDL